MRAYPLWPSFTMGNSFTLCVQPGKQFSIAIYRQGNALALTPSGYHDLISTGGGVVLAGQGRGRNIYVSSSSTQQRRWDTDWQWPQITLKLQAQTVQSAAYAIVVYEVDAQGNAMDNVGGKIVMSQPIYPYPTDSDSMALVIGRPAQPSARIAYVLPTATYHAYNWTGGGCFYGYQSAGTLPSNLVTLRRPGGGLGAQMLEPPDYYDTGSPRQQFGHWDAKFIAWLMQKQIAFDLYDDLDLHNGLIDATRYSLILSVGHHEYWSQSMRDHLNSFLTGGGNYACFSGNTCYRPVDFGAYRTSEFMSVVRHLWPMENNRPVDHWPFFNETQLIGLSWNWGGGKWGDYVNGAWTNLQRNPYGFKVANAAHWVFAGTDLVNNQTFGDQDFLVGYEADGMPPSGSGFAALAQSPRLAGMVNNGIASLGLKGTDTTPRRGLVFNAATTDWARVLASSSAASQPVVAKITSNVLSALSTPR